MNRILKERALNSLKGNWVKVMAVILIFTAITAITTLVYNFLTAPYGLRIDTAVENYMADRISVDALLDEIFAVTNEVSLYSLIETAGDILTFFLQLAVVNFVFCLAAYGKADYNNFFSYVKYFGKSFWLMFLMGLKIFLWSLLLIVPGIIKIFAYAMAPYIMAENPELSASECIHRSEEMMNGEKANLFSFYFSFIGWAILSGIAGGIISTVWSLIPVPWLVSILDTITSTLVVLPYLAFLRVSEGHFYLNLRQKEKAYENTFTGGDENNYKQGETMEQDENAQHDQKPEQGEDVFPEMK